MPEYINLLEHITRRYKLPEGYDTWGIRSVRPDFTSSRGYCWPFPGNVATATGPRSESDQGCPQYVGDGLCLAHNWSGMASGYIPAITLLLCAYRQEDVWGQEDSKVRVASALVVDVLDGQAVVRVPRADLYRADLSGADLRDADLSGANLYRANLYRTALTWVDLSGADLSKADLTGADLTEADLTGADLTEADLPGANLSFTNLTGANLTGANLSGADLSRAYLSGANLSGADLSRANLTGAYLTGANLSGADLTGANLSGVIGYTP